MKVGDYGRTIYGQITKIKYKFEKLNISQRIIKVTVQCEDDELYDYPSEIKTSPKIKDLIEVGDIIRFEIECGLENSGILKGVTQIEDVDMLKNINENKRYHIKSIVTKEQFSQMEYRIGE